MNHDAPDMSLPLEVVEREFRSQLNFCISERERTGWKPAWEGDKDAKEMGYFDFFGHFIVNMPTASGEFVRNEYNQSKLSREPSGKQVEQFNNDIMLAISESGVDASALADYRDHIMGCGSYRNKRLGLTDGIDVDKYEKLVAPVYVRLRAMGYTEFELKGHTTHLDTA